MSTYKFIQCDLCDKKSESVSIVDGWQGWGSLKGVLNDDTKEDEIQFCPECMVWISHKLIDRKEEIK